MPADWALEKARKTWRDAIAARTEAINRGDGGMVALDAELAVWARAFEELREIEER